MEKSVIYMSNVKEGNVRIMVTLPEKLVGRLERDTKERGLDLTKSARIQLALENELSKSNTGFNKEKHGKSYEIGN